MSLDKSLKSQGALTRHRNVLSRTERVSALKDEERWPEGRTVFGLPKVTHRKIVTKKPKAAAKAAEGVPVEGVAPAEGAAPAEAPAAGKPKGKVGS
ncbi:MAG TPA: small basic protein [Phycisphaerae bacterium]|nr:small basic protein [Phycisphaerae bacterium]